MQPPISQWLLLLLFLWAPSSHLVVQATQCSVCRDGSPVPLLEKPLGRNNDAIPIKTCGELDSIVGGMGEQMKNCQSARAVGSFCGCPIVETACRLCGTSLFVGLERGSLPTIVDAQDFIEDSPSTNMTCESVESFLHSMDHSDEGVCHEVKELASFECCIDASEVRYTGATDVPLPTDAPTVLELIEDASVTLETTPSGGVYNNNLQTVLGLYLLTVVTFLIF